MYTNTDYKICTYRPTVDQFLYVQSLHHAYFKEGGGNGSTEVIHHNKRMVITQKTHYLMLHVDKLVKREP